MILHQLPQGVARPSSCLCSAAVQLPVSRILTAMCAHRTFAPPPESRADSAIQWPATTATPPGRAAARAAASAVMDTADALFSFAVSADALLAAPSPTAAFLKPHDGAGGAAADAAGRVPSPLVPSQKVAPIAVPSSAAAVAAAGDGDEQIRHPTSSSESDELDEGDDDSAPTSQRPGGRRRGAGASVSRSAPASPQRPPSSPNSGAPAVGVLSFADAFAACSGSGACTHQAAAVKTAAGAAAAAASDEASAAPPAAAASPRRPRPPRPSLSSSRILDLGRGKEDSAAEDGSRQPPVAQKPHPPPLPKRAVSLRDLAHMVNRRGGAPGGQADEEAAGGASAPAAAELQQQPPRADAADGSDTSMLPSDDDGGNPAASSAPGRPAPVRILGRSAGSSSSRSLEGLASAARQRAAASGGVAGAAGGAPIEADGGGGALASGGEGEDGSATAAAASPAAKRPRQPLPRQRTLQEMMAFFKECESSDVSTACDLGPMLAA